MGTLALGLWALQAMPVRAQEVLLRSLTGSNDARPIQLVADGVTTWADGGRQVFLLKGQVWIEQGVTSLRAPQAVVWVDQGKKKETGAYEIEVYGEDLALENAFDQQSAKIAILQMKTRGDVRVKSYANKAVQERAATDALYLRALAAVKAAQPGPTPLPTPPADKIKAPERQPDPNPFFLETPAPLPFGENVTSLPLPLLPEGDPGIQLTQGFAPPPVPFPQGEPSAIA
jgi:lipopolysaccharide export system protein LptA